MGTAILITAVVAIVILVIVVAWFGPRPNQWRTHSDKVEVDQEQGDEGEGGGAGG